jgi:hypothetical protein
MKKLNLTIDQIELGLKTIRGDSGRAGLSTLESAFLDLLALHKRCAELEETHQMNLATMRGFDKLRLDLEAERDAWREDARRLYNAAFTSLVDTCMNSSRTAPEVKHDYRVAHNALVAKYPAEPAKDTEWTAEEILRREG